MCNFCEDIAKVSKIPSEGDTLRDRGTGKSTFYADILGCTPQRGFIGFDTYPKRPYPYTSIVMNSEINVVENEGSFYLVANSHAVQERRFRNPRKSEWNVGDTIIVSQIFYCPYCGKKLQ